MASKISPGVAMTQFLNSIPNDFRPTRHYPNLLAAAARLDGVSPSRAAQDAAVCRATIKVRLSVNQDETAPCVG